MADNNTSEKLVCGIIMPIAAMGIEYPEGHWIDIRTILHRAIERAGFIPRIVSDSEDATIIHKSIIQNIYNDAIIVCDVSGKNANVMFELGMRLAFNKPVVIIKDDLTGYSFDTSNIEHLGYRKDLRFQTIESFITSLSQKIKATYEKSISDNPQTFLSHFGNFEVAKIDNQTIGATEALEQLLNKVSKINENLDDKNIQQFKNLTSSPLYAVIKIKEELPFNIMTQISQDTFNNYQYYLDRVSFSRNSFNLKWDNGISSEDKVSIFSEIELFIENQIQKYIPDDLPF
ncbi:MULTISPECIES: hypothetical protein [Acinetobacter]|jgi:hypothetical protein|nr:MULTISPECIES: hypothetical protein [Acinetobacter]MDI1225902.1 hypothetical protein [Acinetobacter sp.]UOH18957.1 hypothetical protein MTO68_01850 [Acinetobacter sp. NyZ410]